MRKYYELLSRRRPNFQTCFLIVTSKEGSQAHSYHVWYPENSRCLYHEIHKEFFLDSSKYRTGKLSLPHFIYSLLETEHPNYYLKESTEEELNIRCRKDWLLGELRK